VFEGELEATMLVSLADPDLQNTTTRSPGVTVIGAVVVIEAEELLVSST